MNDSDVPLPGVSGDADGGHSVPTGTGTIRANYASGRGRNASVTRRASTGSRPEVSSVIRVSRSTRDTWTIAVEYGPRPYSVVRTWVRVVVVVEVRPLRFLGLSVCAEGCRRGDNAPSSTGVRARVPVEVFDAERSVGNGELMCGSERPGEAGEPTALIASRSQCRAKVDDPRQHWRIYAARRATWARGCRGANPSSLVCGNHFDGEAHRSHSGRVSVPRRFETDPQDAVSQVLGDDGNLPDAARSEYLSEPRTIGFVGAGNGLGGSKLEFGRPPNRCLSVLVRRDSQYLVSGRRRQVGAVFCPCADGISTVPRHLFCWLVGWRGVWLLDYPNIASRAVLDEAQQDLVANSAFADEIVAGLVDYPKVRPGRTVWWTAPKECLGGSGPRPGIPCRSWAVDPVEGAKAPNGGGVADVEFPADLVDVTCTEVLAIQPSRRSTRFQVLAAS